MYSSTLRAIINALEGARDLTPDALAAALRQPVNIGGGSRHERFDAIVRCIGPALERAESDNPLMRSLFDRGIAKPDPTGLGFITDEKGRLVGPDDRSAENMFAIGALRRPVEWESTAVPDISKQAMGLARHLSG